MSALPLSIGLATVVTLLSAIICLPASYAFARMNFPGRQALLLSFLATNAFPRFGLFVSIAVVFYRLNLIGTIPGVILIQIVNTLLLMIWIPTAAFQNVDRSLEEAALDVGASRVRVFLQVTLPLVLPALSAALLLTYVSTFYEAQGALDCRLAGHTHNAGLDVLGDQQPGHCAVRRGNFIGAVAAFSDTSPFCPAFRARQHYFGGIWSLTDGNP